MPITENISYKDQAIYMNNIVDSIDRIDISLKRKSNPKYLNDMLKENRNMLIDLWSCLFKKFEVVALKQFLFNKCSVISPDILCVCVDSDTYYSIEDIDKPCLTIIDQDCYKIIDSPLTMSKPSKKKYFNLIAYRIKIPKY